MAESAAVPSSPVMSAVDHSPYQFVSLRSPGLTQASCPVARGGGGVSVSGTIHRSVALHRRTDRLLMLPGRTSQATGGLRTRPPVAGDCNDDTDMSAVVPDVLIPAVGAVKLVAGGDDAFYRFMRRGMSTGDHGGAYSITSDDECPTPPHFHRHSTLLEDAEEFSFSELEDAGSVETAASTPPPLSPPPPAALPAPNIYASVRDRKRTKRPRSSS